MALTRRQFLTLMGGSAGAAVLFQACGVPEKELFIDSPIEMPEDLVSGIDNWYATVCPYSDTSEGVVVRVMEGRAKKVEGNVDYPVNIGAHSARSEASVQALYHPDRISAPLVRTGPRGSGEYSEISWTDAIARLTGALNDLDDQGNLDHAVLVTNPIGGHLGLVVDKFVSASGCRHLTHEPIETASVRQAIKEVFSQDAYPDFDINNADLVLSFGADFLSTWVSPTRYSRGYGEFRQGHDHRGKLIHIESRFSHTAANADQWVRPNPGTEGILALAIIQEIVSHESPDPSVVDALTGGDPSWLDSYAPDNVAARTGVEADVIRHIAHDFSHASHPISVGGGSAAAHSNGLSAMKAVFSLNHLAGNIGTKGGVILNPVSPLRGVNPVGPGNSFSDFQRLTEDMQAGNVEVLMVRGADPYYGIPKVASFQERLANVPLIVSFSNMMDDTTSVADLILPEHNFLEDWGTDVPLAGVGYQTVGFQQPVVRPFFENRGENLGTKGFADILLTSAQVMGKDLGFSSDTFKDVIRDGARELYQRGGGSVEAPSFEAFWNGILQRGGWWDVESTGPSSASPVRLDGVSEPIISGNGAFNLQPFLTSSLLDGRLAFLPWLQAMPDPVSTATWQTWVEINHEVAEERDIKEGDVLQISTARGTISALAMPNPATPPDAISIPVGQGHRDHGRYASGRGANVLSILDAVHDESTGSLAWAATKADIRKTGEWIRVPKFENTVPDFPRDEHNHVIELTSDLGGSH